MVMLAAVSCPPGALAAPQTYEYRVYHPLYGDIGTYTNVVNAVGESTDVTSRLKIAVKVLGITMFRQEAERVEHWQGDRLVSFHGDTVTNGEKLAIDGEARGNGFAITTPEGTVTAPANIHPSNPWSAKILDTDVMMSTRSGAVFKVRVSGGGIEPAGLDGNPQKLRRYEIDSNIRQFVWLDERGFPVAFRTTEDGNTVDFLLMRYPAGQSLPWSIQRASAARQHDESIAAMNQHGN